MKTARLVVIVVILVTISLVESSPRCKCTDSEQVIHVHPTQNVKLDKCSLTLDELVRKSITDLLSSCTTTRFIVHKGFYVVNKHLHRSLPAKKDIALDQINIWGEPRAIIESTSESFMISRVFGKATNTISINNIEFHNCKEILIESNLKEAVVKLKDCTLNKSCLNFNFSKHIKETEIMISNSSIINCNCSDGIVQISSTPTVRTHFHSNITFHNVSVTDNFSPFLIVSELQILVMLRGYCIFRNNKDFRIQIKNSTLLFSGARVAFDNNRLTSSTAQGTTIIAKQAIITFKDSAVKFSENEGFPSGGITAKDSTKIVIEDNVTINFTKNKGQYGGALSLYTESQLIFNSTQSLNATINFMNNMAQFGGGIYVEDRGYSEVKSVIDLQSDSELVKVNFQNNSALLGGNQIYGGWIWLTEQCEDITHILNFNSDDNNQSLVASDPIRICLCSKDEVIECNKTEHMITIYGCTLDIALVAVGQNFTPVVAYVEAAIESSERSIEESLRIEILQKRCTNIKYTIPGFQEEVITLLHLKPYLSYAKLPDRFNNSRSQILFTQLTIPLKKKDCALGYMKKENSCECICLPLLTSIEVNCDPNGHISRNEQQWVGITCTATENAIVTVVAQKRCPFDYCRADKNPLTIRLEDPDEQCAFNRSGILCGGCKMNFSRILGSSKCIRCSNHKLIIIVPGILLAGLILVILLILLDLTVSVGTISGLIFYANIIRAQHITFFGSETTFRLNVFIAWLNFDLGIETCLFDGLDSYVEIWLQFCFPLYISIVVFIIIVSSHYSMRISKLCSKNIVPVLATLFLLSYTKLLQLVVDVFTFTNIKYPDGHTKPVWLYDGNVDYLKGKHIPLFLATMLLQILLAIYPLSLVSIQWLVKISHHRAMSWVQKLKPFFDAYTGPYKADHCYWTGLLLIVRIILLVTFTLNRNYSPTYNLLAVTVVSVGLLTYLATTKGIYKNSLPNYLELFFFCNLSLTSAAVQFELANDSHGQHSGVPIKISTGVTVLVFVGIIFFHILRRILWTSFGAKIQNSIMRWISLKRNAPSDDIQLPLCSTPQVTSTLIELNEPLLEC